MSAWMGGSYMAARDFARSLTDGRHAMAESMRVIDDVERLKAWIAFLDRVKDEKKKKEAEE